RTVMRYDVCQKRQLSDFASGLSPACLALRLRENGEVLVACENQVYRLSPTGSVLRTYPYSGNSSLFAMNLDPDGIHFWTGPLSGVVYKVHIENGSGLSTPVFDATKAMRSSEQGRDWLSQLRRLVVPNDPLGGLAIYGERTAAIAEVRRRSEERQRQEELQRAEEARRRQEAEEAARLAEEERQRREAEEAARQAEEERRRQEAEEARRAEEERRRREAEEAARRAEEERRRREEEERRKRLGTVRFGPPIAVNFGPIAASSTAESRLDLSGTRVEERADARISTTLEAPGLVLEIDTGDGWRALGTDAVTLPIVQAGSRQWPLRVRTGRCPGGLEDPGSYGLRIEAKSLDQSTAVLQIPVALVVVRSSWLQCWWPALATALGIALGLTVIHGFVSPSRFPPRLGVRISPEDDVNEGFLHPIRATRGTRRGFYRDARVYVASDFRLRAKAAGTLARLRAHGQQVRIKPVAGTTVWRQTADGDWVALPADESPARRGVLYRDDLETIFFELRNG
ncbi:MAG: hypothetical protein V3T72_19775, partial [Thermoanaerobaculia bacterium]